MLSNKKASCVLAFFVMGKLPAAYILAYDKKIKIIKDIYNELSQPTLFVSFIFYTLCL